MTLHIACSLFDFRFPEYKISTYRERYKQQSEQKEKFKQIFRGGEHLVIEHYRHKGQVSQKL